MVREAMDFVKAYDPELGNMIEAEYKRQQRNIELIASENIVSEAVMAAMGSVLTNKYAEGYPGKRYYGGCECVDEVERLAISRVCEVFGAKFANVQPHSGAQANMAVYQALCKPGDTVMGMSLDNGGHLTHGSPVNQSGLLYHIVSYGVDDNGYIDYDAVREMAKKEQPKMIIAGFSAYSQIIDWAKFREIADSVGAYLLVDMAHVAGLVAAGVYPSPLAHAHVVTTTTHKTLRGPRGGLILSAENDAEIEKKLQAAVFPGGQGGPLMHVIAAKAVCFKEAMDPEFKSYQQQVVKNAQAMAGVFIERGYEVVSGGTEDHLFLLSLVKQGLTGKDADAALGRAHITVNKNAVPNDPQSPFVTSGLRIGTPAVTTRGFGEAECSDLAGWICDILDAMQQGDSSEAENAVKGQVEAVCGRLPVYR